MKNQLALVAGLFSGALLLMAATPAMAHVDVQVQLGSPGYYVQPAPVYVQPRPVYVEPRRVYVEPQPIYVEQRPYFVEREYRHSRHWNGRHGGWDRDRDGVPDRFDRDRDGDGVPNRFDRRPNNPYRD